MSAWISWKIAKKEFTVISRKKSIIFYIIFLPLLLSFGFSILVQNDIATSTGISPNASLGLDSLTYFFVVLAAVLPATIAAYSIVGEKIEKSLEPLLATPITDGEILLGKSIAAFLPPIFAIWGGASIFMAISDFLTYKDFSYYYFPNWNAGVMLLLLAPLAAIFSIEVAVIASSRVNDVRGANQIASLMFIPFMVVFLGAVEGIIAFSISNLLIISGVVLIVDLALFFLSTSTFKREEILTKWK